MHYLCLAAGKGTRFGRLGSYLQKCMYPIGLKPFLEYAIQNLLKSSSLDLRRDCLTIVVGHFKEQIQRYFGTRYEGLDICYLEQAEALGTGHALYLAYEALQVQEPVIAWLADLYVPTALFRAIDQHPEVNVQTIGPGQIGEKEDLKVTIQDGLIQQAWQGRDPFYDLGLWKLAPEVLKLMTQERHGEYRMLPNLQLAIERGQRVGYIKQNEWLHLGGTQPTPEENVRGVVRRILELERA